MSDNGFLFRNITLVEATKLVDKQKWISRFMSSYSGGKRKVSSAMFESKCKFLVAVEDGKELGYIRLVDYSSEFELYGANNVWNISEAYVKPCYRKSGVLRAMIKQVVEKHNAKVIRIETARLTQYVNYYKTLGFTYAYTVQDGELALAFQNEIVSAAVMRNADKMQASNENYQLAA